MCQLKNHEYEQRETRMDEFIVHDVLVVRSNIARFRQEQQRLKAQGGLSTTAEIAAAAGAIGVLDSDEVDGGFGAAAAAETGANGDIDGNDNDKGNAGVFGQLGITEAISGSGDGRKMTVEEAAVYRKALAASASSRALGAGPSRRQWVRRYAASFVSRWFIGICVLGRKRLWSRAAADRRAASSVSRWFVCLCWLGRAQRWPCAAPRRAA